MINILELLGILPKSNQGLISPVGQQDSTDLLSKQEQQSQNWFNDLMSLISSYKNEVEENKETPFFNRNNTPQQWMGKVIEDIKKRGISEGLQDLTYPITKNPYIEPMIEPIISKVRVANYEAGRPIPLINSLLGQQDWQMVPEAISNLQPLWQQQGGENLINQLIKSRVGSGELISPRREDQPTTDNIYNVVMKPSIPQSTSIVPESPYRNLVGKYWDEDQINNALNVMFRESSYNPKTIGKLGEVGLMQILPETFKSETEIRKNLGIKSIEELKEPKKNIQFAYELYKKYGWQPWTTAKSLGLLGGVR